MRIWIAALWIAAAVSGSAWAAKETKKADKKAAAVKASEQTVRAVGELMGKFKWGMTPEQAKKLVEDETNARYQEKIVKERDPLRQDAIRRELTSEIEKVNDSMVKFDGQKTGWDVSLIDHEFAHNDGESMFVIWEKDQRRFLFFFNGKLWKQFIAFNAEHPAFAGKGFDDFAEIIQKRYGTASVTFRKQRTNDEQTFDHLEWPPSGDTVLWAIDMTQLYNNFCLSLFHKEMGAEVEKSRQAHAVRQTRAGASSALIDSVTSPEETPGDVNANIADEITGRKPTPAQQAEPAHKSRKRGK